jgi:hypothetical protein
MVTLEASLAQLVISGGVTLDTAKAYTSHVDDLLRLIS